MSRVPGMAAMLLALLLSGCAVGTTATTGGPTEQAPALRSPGVTASEAGSDVGNDRPRVTNDGLMVRRRVVLAVRPTGSEDLESVMKELNVSAARRHTSLSSISVSVLDPALLERLSPQLVVALPAGATLDDARKVVEPSRPTGPMSPHVAEWDVASVLVHDLRFTARSADPARLARDIAREGILSDALGNYSATAGQGELFITYTGPLLSDDLVTSVRDGIGRRTGTGPSGVTVSPRSLVGVGVDLAKEPTPVPADVVSTAHRHGSAPLVASPGAAAPSASSPSGTQITAIGLALLVFVLTQLLLRTARPGDPVDQQRASHSDPDTTAPLDVLGDEHEART